MLSGCVPRGPACQSDVPAASILQRDTGPAAAGALPPEQLGGAHLPDVRPQVSRDSSMFYTRVCHISAYLLTYSLGDRDGGRGPTFYLYKVAIPHFPSPYPHNVFQVRLLKPMLTVNHPPTKQQLWGLYPLPPNCYIFMTLCALIS